MRNIYIQPAIKSRSLLTLIVRYLPSSTETISSNAKSHSENNISPVPSNNNAACSFQETFDQAKLLESADLSFKRIYPESGHHPVREPLPPSQPGVNDDHQRNIELSVPTRPNLELSVPVENTPGIHP